MYEDITENGHGHDCDSEIPLAKRASALTMRYQGQKYKNIGATLDLEVKTLTKFIGRVRACAGIPPRERLTILPLTILLSDANLLSAPRSGRPKVLSEAEKDHLVSTVKSNRDTRRLQLSDIQKEASLERVSKGTVLNALHERGLKAYRENKKFMLRADHKTIR